ncbi:ABC transporter ATP-binding protein [Salinicoccus hispanicus]|uniref:Dipeptide ABC transporter ATP-binding protein n=1 Tax=Salinicoccus hispanicus TaxID=157225 RepID=A0A6N8TYH5_9STAP|nr:dipeptide ABC transporter ATP-binding protein [Salinicoccus hispanicus]MXQ51038.1 dipeptide ABC transporter ATP-binding protein [Salinicoccus hispanicus]
MSNEYLLEIKELKKHFPIKEGFMKEKKVVKAVDSISFNIKQGETFGLVGESGCGKSTTGRLINGLIDADSGEIIFNNHQIDSLSTKQWRKVRKEMQMVFQDPYASLSPRMTVKEILMEPLNIHFKNLNEKEKEERVELLLKKCGINPYHLNKYAHEFSGGQRQRIGIARALILQPQLIIADEPVSALDVSIQSQILNLMKDLQEEFNLTYLFVSHDLSVIEFISDRIGVMYLGDIVEISSKEKIFNDPKHPYTKALLSAIPQIGETSGEEEEVSLQGDIPSASNPPSGCKFHTRCPFAMEQCKTIIPRQRILNDEQTVACHLYEEGMINNAT